MLQTILSVLLTTTFGLPLVIALILLILAMIIAAPVIKLILRVVAVIAIIATIPYAFSMFISGQIIATCIVIVGYILLIVILAIINAIF